MKKNNTTEIATALRAFFRPGDVFEVRILDAMGARNTRPHVESGYFDYDHIYEVPKELEQVYGYRGVYVTVNPPRPELLARAANRLRDVRRDPITTDADVPRRRWLLIDCDAKRPSGIASNSTEHQAALDKAAQIRADLMAAGWPEPISTDSGNGAQLMWPVDLPADDNGLIQSAIAGIAEQYTDDQVDIDLTVHNPARIWRLPGTYNVKGDEVGDRQHRMARILHRPDNFDTPVTEDQLKAWQPATAASSSSSSVDISGIITNGTRAPEAFDLDSWIASHAPELGAPQAWQGGRKWVFETCPFNDAHRNRSAVLIQQQSGAVVFRCHHNGCVGNDWHAFRALRDPEYADRLANPAKNGHGAAIYGGELDDTATIAEERTNTQQEPEASQKAIAEPPPVPGIRHPDPGPMPDDLLTVPGFIQEVIDYDLATAPYPNKVLAFSGALCLLAFLTGRKYRDKSNVMPSIYLIALANSGSGKDHPRKVNIEIAYQADMAQQIGDAFASGEGIEDAVMQNQNMMFQTDEIDGLFQTINKAKDGRNEMIMNILLKLYSSSNSVYIKRALAMNQNGRQRNMATICDRPGLTLFGTAVPKFLYEALNGRMLENGFFARTIIVEASGRGQGQEVEFFPPPQKIVDTAQYWSGYIPEEVTAAGNGNLFSEHPQPHVVPPADDNVQELYTKYRLEADALYSENEKANDLTATSLWNRAFEKARKLAILYALSNNPKDPVITEEAISWGWRFAKYITERQLYMADSYVADNPFHQLCLKFTRRLKAAGGRMDHCTLLRNMHIKVTDLEAVAQYLRDAGEITLEYDDSGRQLKPYYQLTNS